MSDVVVLPSLLLRELGSSKSGAGVLSGGSEEDEDDNRAALATVLLPVDKKNALVVAVDATANIFALR